MIFWGRTADESVCLSAGFSLLMYNVTGMFVTDSIGAVARTVLESLRTLFVWLVKP